MGVYTRLIRPLLFVLSPETAQHLAEFALGITPLWKTTRPFLQLEDERLRCDIGGIKIPNPVGLAAGYDKDARLVSGLANLGFGYIVVGTVVAQPRGGNPRPRLVRDPAKGSLTNSLGFPSRGVERVVRNLMEAGPQRVPLLVSVSGLSVGEFSLCYRALQPLVAGVELNISSPNTEGVRVFQDPKKLDELLLELTPHKEKPLFLKLPPFFDDTERGRVMDILDLCIRHSIDGVTAVNTWPVEDNRLAVGKGGMSGKPLYPHMLRMVEELRKYAGSRLTINACGGIFSGEDALNALKAGANSVQVFTVFIYQGPGTAMRINRHLLHATKREGVASVGDTPFTA